MFFVRSALENMLRDAMKKRFSNSSVYYAYDMCCSEMVDVVYVDKRSKFYSGIKKCDKFDNSGVVNVENEVLRHASKNAELGLCIASLKDILRYCEGMLSVVNRFVKETPMHLMIYDYMSGVIHEYVNKNGDLKKKKIVLYFDVKKVEIQESAISFGACWDARIIDSNDPEYWLSV